MLEIRNLRIDFLNEPIGIDSYEPFISWELYSDDSGVYQKSVKVFIFDHEKENIVWEYFSDSSEMGAKAVGADLEENSKYHIIIYATDQNSNVGRISSDFSTSYFRGEESFKTRGANWISSFSDACVDIEREKVHWSDNHSDDSTLEYDSSEDISYLFSKDFEVGKSISFAQVSICGLGYYELYLNGNKVGNHVLDPAYTAFDKRCFYVSYDILEDIKSGTNRLNVLLGNGFYDQSALDIWGFQNARWRGKTRFILTLQIKYSNGKTQIISSDDSWRFHESYIKYQNIRCGERHDMRELRFSGGFKEDITKWPSAYIISDFSVPNLTAESMPPIRIIKAAKPSSIDRDEDGACIVKFPQNMTGWAKLVLTGSPGQTVKIEFLERHNLNWDMDIPIDVRLDEFVKKDFQCFYVTLSGGLEICEPKFSYYGFQYLKITGLEYVPKSGDITGYFIHTDLKRAGKLDCSLDMVNKIHAMTVRTFLNNYHSIPTDCPHREKNGWMCDGWLASEAGILNFDMLTSYKKWIQDMADDQYISGNMSPIVPNCDWGIADDRLFDVQWTGAMIMICDYLYRYYGKTDIIEDNYSNMVRFLNYVQGFIDNSLFKEGLTALGDWLDVDEKPFEDKVWQPGRTDNVFCNDIFYYVLLIKMADFAKILDIPDDISNYNKTAASVKLALNKKYLREDARYFDNSQMSMAMAICFDLLPEDVYDKAVNNFITDIAEKDNYHLNTGIVGTKYLFDALYKLNRCDLAFKIICQEDYPGYGFMVKNGSTTLWEDWKAAASLSHPMLGSIDAFFYKVIGGINYNYNYLNIKIPDKSLGISYSRARYHSIQGSIYVRWEYTDNALVVDLEVPIGIKAGLETFKGKTSLTSGRFSFKFDL